MTKKWLLFLQVIIWSYFITHVLASANFRDINFVNNALQEEGSVTRIINRSFQFKSSSNIEVSEQKYFLNDSKVKPFLSYAIAPVIQSTTVISAYELDVLFDQPLESTSSQEKNNYVVNNSINSPATALLDAINPALVHLTFTNNFPNGKNCQLTVNSIKDLSGNAIVNATATFVYIASYTTQQYDVVIDEIMADPTPVVALPNNEWIELRNISTSAINLKGWKIGDLNSISGAMPNFILQPDSFVIICSGSAAASLIPFGRTLSVTTFPSLDNDEDQLSLISSEGKVIHAVNYSSLWYQNELKKAGGWTLEMIDTRNPCSGISNWKASTDLNGGSPGRKNATQSINPDQSAPKLLRAYAVDNITVTLVFDEPLDSLKAAVVAGYSISDGIGLPVTAVAVSPVFDKVNLRLSTPLAASKIYTITNSAITDCVGNAISSKNTARVGISRIADSLDIVINEILFNPPPTGSDFVEIYNRSNKVIDLKQTYIANRSSNGTISNITQISKENYLFFPQDFMVLTPEVADIKAAYINQNPDAFIAINLPSFNDDNGNVVILNAQGDITDELAYCDKWHFKLLDNTEGVALERIDYNATTQSADNWHSAATSAGYGTPTYKNSQYHMNDGVKGDIKLSPEIVSPDNDGQDDFATLEYNFSEPGYVATITIFDAVGRPVRYLQGNALCGTKGSFKWDGLGEKNQSLVIGVYIVYTTIFNLQGKTKQFKIPLVLARRN